MIDKITILVACMAFCKMGIDAKGIYLSPDQISQSSNNRIQVSQEPAPIYEPDVEFKTQADAIQPSVYLKSLDTRNSNLNNYNNAIFSAVPKSLPQNVQSPILNNLYSVPPSNINGYPTTIALLNSYSNQKAVQQTHRREFATDGVPLVQNAVKTITYSDAPAVSHTTFTGLGTAYTW